VSQPSRARLECLLGVALGGLLLTIGVFMPLPWLHVMTVAGAIWAVSALGVMIGTSAWDTKSPVQRRRLVWASHWCGLLPLVLAIGTEGAAVGSGTSIDSDDFSDSE
jgi:hypothetical protein